MLSSILFSLSQRLFWRKVRIRNKEWQTIISGNQKTDISIGRQSVIRLYSSSELSKYIYSGAFEWAEREWLLKELKEGDVFYDIGANIGYFTILAAEKCGRNGHVFAFEPVKSTFELLTENVKLNPHLNNISLMNYAVSDREENLLMYLPEKGKDAWNSIAVKPEGEHFKTEIIMTWCPDLHMKEETFIRPSLIKIDVEGWELHVLKGMKNILTAFQPTLLIEFTAANLKAAGTSGTELAAFLQSMNYRLYEYIPRYNKIERISSFEFEHKNLIAKV
ncbi:MAG: hypothetical protein Fur0041_03160 [Bacteroidia bacterium]